MCARVCVHQCAHTLCVHACVCISVHTHAQSHTFLRTLNSLFYSTQSKYTMEHRSEIISISFLPQWVSTLKCLKIHNKMASKLPKDMIQWFLYLFYLFTCWSRNKFCGSHCFVLFGEYIFSNLCWFFIIDTHFQQYKYFLFCFL